VADATQALLLAADRLGRTGGYQVFNAAPEVMTIGRLACTVRQLAQVRGKCVRVDGASNTCVHVEDGSNSADAFQVESSLAEFEPTCSLTDSLGEVFDFFLGMP
jgi:hypothetical protein